MAVSIPILSSFDNRGIKGAIREFKNLETTGQKAQFALKKAAVPAALALGALAAAAGKALAAGEAVSTANARIAQINKSMGLFGDETDAVTNRLVKLAEATAMQTGMDNLSIKATQAKLLTFANLAKTAGKVGGAFDRANKAALDMAAAGFGSAEGNAVQLGKALENPIKGIAALAKSGVTFTDQEKEKIKTLVESNKMLEAQDMVLKAIEKQIGGTAEATANDTNKMKEGFKQFQQQLGLALLPVLQAVTPILLKMASWAKDNPGIFIAIGAAIATIAVAITAVNIAMALNPFSLILIGVAALGAALVIAYKKFEPFRNVVDNVFGAIKFWINNVTIPSIKTMLTVFKTVFNAIASAWNNTVGKISFKLPSWIPGLGGKGFDMPNIPQLANGGIVTSPTLALIGERGAEAVIPLTGANAGAGLGGNNVTIHVNGGDPNAVVAALRTYMRINGAVPIRTIGTA
tara:strand:- start:1586 stop:2974 length:1389 start_codon:yes stop_codon:yes gene_type:complete